MPLYFQPHIGGDCLSVGEVVETGVKGKLTMQGVFLVRPAEDTAKAKPTPNNRPFSVVQDLPDPASPPGFLASA